MANGTVEKNLAAPAAAFTPMAVGALVLGWLIPGAGHLLLKRWIRGGLIMASVAIMFFMGLAMQGKVYSFNTGDLLDILGFIGDLGSGILYFMAKVQEWGQSAIFRATSDYGTKFLIVAGLLNVISAIDAYHIAIRKKQ